LSELVKGNIYLIEEERLGRAPQIFSKEAKGKRGLIITRQPLEAEDNDGRLGDFSHFRLALMLGPDTISPHDISEISYKISDFLADRGPGIILFEGLEYLATQNGFQTVLRLVQFIYDKIAGSNCTMLVSLNPLAFSLKEFHQLKNETVRPPEINFEESVELGQPGMLKANP
jgi:hypothetical protein